MIKYIFRRFLELLVALFLIATATFFLTSAAPGDPLVARTMSLPEASRQAMYAKYGLDKPLMERYVITMKGMLHGDFGESVVYEGQTLQDIIRDKLPVSARLGLQSLIFGVLVGLFLGVIAAVKRDTWIDRVIVVFAVLLMSVPELVLGLVFQKYFAGTLKWFPVIGWPSGKELWFGGWKYTILPMMSGALLHIATYSRLLKTSILDVLDQDYILTARSKGLSEPKIISCGTPLFPLSPGSRYPWPPALRVPLSLRRSSPFPALRPITLRRYRPTIFPLYWEKRSLSQHCLLWWYS